MGEKWFLEKAGKMDEKISRHLISLQNKFLEIDKKLSTKSWLFRLIAQFKDVKEVKAAAQAVPQEISIKEFQQFFDL